MTTCLWAGPGVRAGLLALVLLMGCSGAPNTTRPESCAVASIDAPGPRLAARRAATSPKAKAEIYVAEARETGDGGFYVLADAALRCVLETTPDDDEATVLLAHIRLQDHRFAEVEAMLRPVVARADGWFPLAVYGDALMEQGKLDAAAEAYQAAVERRPGVELYDRIGWLRWTWGDVDGALEMARLAATGARADDPERYAWMMTRLGWLHALTGRPSPELDAALDLVPDYRHARLARGRVRLAKGEARALDDLSAATWTWEGRRALAEADPAFDPLAAPVDDRRGHACWLAERDPAAARVLLEAELRERQDSMTRLALLYVRTKLREDVQADTRTIVAEGIAEPRALLYAGWILGDASLLSRAVASGPGLLPSEHAIAAARLAEVGGPAAVKALTSP